jgi:hypothetical protein
VWPEFDKHKTLADMNRFMEGEIPVPMRYVGGTRFKTINIPWIVEAQAHLRAMYHKACQKDPDRVDAACNRFQFVHSWDRASNTGIYDCRACHLFRPPIY